MQHIPLNMIAALFEQTKQGLACFNLEGKITFANEQARKFSGQNELSWASLLREDTSWSQVVETPPQPYLLKGQRISWAVDKQEHIVCVLIDSPQLWQQLEHTGMLLQDKKTNDLVWSNPALFKMLGVTKIADLHQIKWLDHNKTPVPAPWVQPDASNYIAVVDAQNQHHIRIDRQPFKTTTYLLFEDITEHITRAKQQTELISIASHELRNPLTPLKGLLQLAIQQHEEEQTVDFHLLQKAESQISRLVDLANALLDISRLESGKLTALKTKVDLNAALKKMLGVWEARFGKARIRTNYFADASYVNLDAASFEQVINNLLDNAIKFSPVDKPISIELTHQHNDIKISIEDHGSGIDPDHIPHLFTRYYQAKGHNKQGSLGLGLFISQQIVLEHDGHIHVDSKLGGPTIITISIPKYQNMSA